MQSLTIKSSSSGSTGAGDMQSSGRCHTNGPVHAFSSPSESPDSTVDRQKSSLSNNSLKSSKNSSLRTTSSTATAQTVPIDSFHGMTFTEQIQQHSLPRSRSRQSIVSPSSTTKSIGQQPSSPASDFDWTQLKPGLNKASKGNKISSSNGKTSVGDKKKNKNNGSNQVLEYEMTHPIQPNQDQYFIQQQSLAEKKRNGIMTNPNYHLQGNQVFLGRVSVPRNTQNRGHQDVLDNYPSERQSSAALQSQSSVSKLLPLRSWLFAQPDLTLLGDGGWEARENFHICFS
ncbi:hypothetical protein WMY93_009523 [Mugilogobius chulae]|uniref:Uncharacterized protein n=1 Tax=Mugilogobius chulae TaxID=88201 RepID=A0AAW0PC07_9GOBI